MKLFKVSESDHALNIQFFVPGAANALSLEAARELKSLKKTVVKTKKPVLVSSAHPRLFCSGGNLSDYKRLKGKAPGLKVNREITAILNDFAAWPVPKLALIDGDVLGGGMEWLARFDFRWSTPNAFFAFWQRRIGLSTGWGGGKAWAAKLGEDQVRRLLLESRAMGAHESLHAGLVDRVLSPWRLQEEAEQWASRMGGETVRKLLRWNVASETRIFSDLWLAPAHADTLKNWRS